MNGPKTGGDAPLHLHIGGETPKPGWKILNIQPGPHVDFVGTCTDLSRFDGGTVETIYVSHVLEHLSYVDELLDALKEFRRVLRTDGLLQVSVPDFEALCRLFLDPRLDAAMRFHVMRIIFGGQMDPYDFHKAGLTEEFLTDFLTTAAFRDIRRVGDFGLFDDTSGLKLGGVPVSLNLQAKK
jgi:predicted SAM-dependent methyltransferase